MTIAHPPKSRSKFHPNSYQFIFNALRYTQQMLGKNPPRHAEEEEEAHITGQQLLEGIRQLALERYGLLAKTVFRQWNITCTEDFGKIVFELVDRGEMRKTDEDSLDDFRNIFEFDAALDRAYEISTTAAFRK